jgi:hypothetical protein
MTFIYAIIAGIVGAAAGWLLTALVTTVIAGMLGVSNFEGAIGFLAIWGTGPIGGLFGLLFGMFAVLRYRGGYRSFGAIAARGIAAVAVIATLGAITISFMIANIEHFSDGNPTMHFEIRLPAGLTIAERTSVTIEMQAGSQRSDGYFNDAWLRADGDRAVLSGFVPLYTRTSLRMLVLKMPDQKRLIFSIALSATPAKSESFGAWRRVDMIDDGKASDRPRRSDAADQYEIRVHVPDWTVPYMQPAK